jgi:hypothetical protein
MDRDPHAPALGPHGEPCASCGAPLSADQRYCFECGTRRAAPRLDFLGLLAARRAAPMAGPAAAPARPRARGRAVPAPRSLALAGMAFVMAGVLLGTALGTSPSETLASAARQVVVVSGGVAGTGASPPADSGATADSGGGSADTAAAPDSSTSSTAAAPAASTASSGSALTDGQSTGLDAPVAPTPAPAEAPSSSPPAGGGPAPAPSVGHVFVLAIGGARGFEDAFGKRAPAGWLRDELPKRGRLLAGYRPVGPEGPANRIALVSGRGPETATEPGCAGADCLYGAEVKTIGDQLSTVGLAWRAYVEGLDRPCRRPDGQNPFVRFHSVVDTSDCAKSVVVLDALTKDLRTTKTAATLSWIAPNPCHAGDAGPCDGASTAPAATDAFLARWVPAILRSAAFRKDGLLVVVGERPPAGAPASDPVGAVLVSPFVTAGKRDPRAYDHYGLLRSLEDRLGLRALGLAGARGVRSLRPDVFDRKLAPLAPPEALPTG